MVAEHPDMSTGEIIQNAMMLCPGIPIVKNDNLRKFIGRTRKKYKEQGVPTFTLNDPNEIMGKAHYVGHQVRVFHLPTQSTCS